MPSRIKRSCSSFTTRAVTATTGVAALFAILRMFFMVVRPSMTGIWMSMKIRSKSVCMQSSMASWPVAAV